MELINQDETRGLQSPQNMELHQNFTSTLANLKDAAGNQCHHTVDQLQAMHWMS